MRGHLRLVGAPDVEQAEQAEQAPLHGARLVDARAAGARALLYALAAPSMDDCLDLARDYARDDVCERDDDAASGA